MAGGGRGRRGGGAGAAGDGGAALLALAAGHLRQADRRGEHVDADAAVALRGGAGAEVLHHVALAGKRAEAGVEDVAGVLDVGLADPVLETGVQDVALVGVLLEGLDELAVAAPGADFVEGEVESGGSFVLWFRHDRKSFRPGRAKGQRNLAPIFCTYPGEKQPEMARDGHFACKIGARVYPPPHPHPKEPFACRPSRPRTRSPHPSSPRARSSAGRTPSRAAPCSTN